MPVEVQHALKEASLKKLRVKEELQVTFINRMV